VLDLSGEVTKLNNLIDHHVCVVKAIQVTGYFSNKLPNSTGLIGTYLLFHLKYRIIHF
jgi:hypothetical protein